MTLRALLTPDLAPETGTVVFRPGREVLPLFMSGRVLIAQPPENLRNYPSGLLPETHQPLAESEALAGFFSSPQVINAAGGLTELAQYLQAVRDCQWPDSDYHHHELTLFCCEHGAVRLCWSCDNRLRENPPPALLATAGKNCAAWITDTVRIHLGFGREHVLTLPELCWWAVVNEIADVLPESAARAALHWPPLEFGTGPLREADIVPSVSASETIQKKTESVTVPDWQDNICENDPAVLTLSVDPESPETFLLRPKRRRWVSEKYTRWVKQQKCQCCGNRADDPHHLIGYGQGGTGTKSHDLFVIPLCRAHHNELHNDPGGFEKKYGSQLELLFRFLDRAMALGVIGGKK